MRVSIQVHVCVLRLSLVLLVCARSSDPDRGDLFEADVGRVRQSSVSAVARVQRQQFRRW